MRSRQRREFSMPVVEPARGPRGWLNCFGKHKCSEWTLSTGTWNSRDHATPGSRTDCGFERQSIFELGFPDDSFDLTVCRHVMHSIPHPHGVLVELALVTSSGGYLHVI